MKVGARNQLKAQVTAIKRGEVMAQIKLVIPAESVMGSVITVESLEEMGLEVGDEVELFVKAVHVCRSSWSKAAQPGRATNEASCNPASMARMKRRREHQLAGSPAPDPGCPQGGAVWVQAIEEDMRALASMKPMPKPGSRSRCLMAATGSRRFMRPRYRPAERTSPTRRKPTIRSSCK
jgi:molybdopterin-binding protein